MLHKLAASVSQLLPTRFFALGLRAFDLPLALFNLVAFGVN